VTFREALRDRLMSNALMPEEAEAVLDAVAAHDVYRLFPEDVHGRSANLAALWAITSRQALAWIDAHHPDHVARPMFEQADAEAAK
jgi:hypothetical protein